MRDSFSYSYELSHSPKVNACPLWRTIDIKFPDQDSRAFKQSKYPISSSHRTTNSKFNMTERVQAPRTSKSINNSHSQISQWENRDSLRTFTGLVNSMPVLDAQVLEAEQLLDRAATIITGALPDLRETCLMREQLEFCYFEKMKIKKELWDGTARLEREPRRYRIRWLKVERKKARVAKWEQANRSNREHELSDSDYSKYTTKSDSEGTLWSTDESVKPSSRKRSRDEESERRKRAKKDAT